VIVTAARTNVSGSIAAGELVPDKQEKYLPSVVSETVHNMVQRAQL